MREDKRAEATKVKVQLAISQPCRAIEKIHEKKQPIVNIIVLKRNAVQKRALGHR